jgi:hypothetical protein
MTKTIRVDKIIEMINKKLAYKELSQNTKRVLCTTLEEILHETHNYHGFNYVKWLNDGYDQWVKDNRPSDNRPYLGEEYSRMYY